MRGKVLCALVCVFMLFSPGFCAGDKVPDEIFSDLYSTFSSAAAKNVSMGNDYRLTNTSPAYAERVQAFREDETVRGRLSPQSRELLDYMLRPEHNGHLLSIMYMLDPAVKGTVEKYDVYPTLLLRSKLDAAWSQMRKEEERSWCSIM